MTDVRCPVVVGRDREIEAVEGLVERAAGGDGGLVFVLGEAGVGKSRLASRGAEAARARGMAVLRGRAAPSPAPAPYRPVTEALLSALRGSGPPPAAELDRLAPALPLLVPPWARPGDAAPAEPSVILLGEAALALLRGAAAGPGAYVVLDDLHWSDAGTLELLDYLADKLEGTGVAVVATSRSGEDAPAERLAYQVRGRGHAQLVELHRLAEDDVAAMVAASLASTEVPADVVAVAARASDGLPFLVEEVLASLLERGSLVAGPGGWRAAGPLDPEVPRSFAALVADRMAQLGPPAAGVLRAAAVLGERFDWRLLEHASGAAPDDVLDALRRAAAVQLVEEDAGAGAFQFRHALTRTAVLGTLLLPERVAIARIALAALEADAATGTSPERLALAAELAETAGDRHRAGDLLLEAAEAALRAGAVTPALAAAGRAVEQGTTAEQVIRGHELLLDSSVTAGDARRVVEIGERLLTRLSAVDAPPERRARAHLRLAGAAVAATDWRRAGEHLRLATALVPDGDDRLELRRRLWQAHLALGEHRLDDAAADAAAAHELAERLGDPDGRCESLELLGRAARVVDLPAAEAYFTRALLVAESAGLALRRARALHELGTIELIRLGPTDRLREAREAAIAAGAPGLAAQAGMHLAVGLMVRYQVAEAREAVARAIAEAERYRLGLLVPITLTVLGALDAIQGRRDDAVARFEQARPMMDAEVEATGRGHVLGLAALAHEDRAGALAELAEAARICPPRSAVAGAPFHGFHALLFALDPDAPTTLLDELLVARSGSLHTATRGLAAMAQAVLAGRAGKGAAAAAHLAEATQVLAGSAWYLNMGRRLVAEAAVADRWGTPHVWLREALDFFVAEGLDAPARACRSLLRQAGAPVPRGAGDGVAPELAGLGVTRREADVLELVAQGLANKDIAGRLYLSARTVEKHVERLLLKTACDNRAQLAAFAARLAAPRT